MINSVVVQYGFHTALWPTQAGQIKNIQVLPTLSQEIPSTCLSAPVGMVCFLVISQEANHREALLWGNPSSGMAENGSLFA